MNDINITANVIKYKKTNGRLWILMQDNAMDKHPIFSANLVGSQVNRLSEVIHENLVVSIKGEVAGVDRNHGSVIIYNPVFIRAYREKKIWDEVAAGEAADEEWLKMIENDELAESECY